MLKATKTITLSKAISLELLREVPAGIRSRVLHKFYRPDVNKTKRFFERFRRKPKEVAITDFSTGHFAAAVIAEMQSLVPKPFDVCVDLGCGNSSLSNIRESDSWRQYVGIDLFIDNEDVANRKVRFIEHDLNSGLPPLDPVESYLFVAVNSFCYVENIQRLFASIKELPGSKTVLILDPHPSLLWESAFHGFRIFLRSAENIVAHLNDSTAQVERTSVHLGLPFLHAWVASNLLKISIGTNRTEK